MTAESTSFSMTSIICFTLIIKTLNTHLLVLFFRLSMSSFRKRKPS